MTATAQPRSGAVGFGPWYALLLQEEVTKKWRVAVHTYPVHYARAERVLRKKPWQLRMYIGPFDTLAQARRAMRMWQDRKKDPRENAAAVTHATSAPECVDVGAERASWRGPNAHLLVMRDVRARQKLRKARKKKK